MEMFMLLENFYGISRVGLDIFRIVWFEFNISIANYMHANYICMCMYVIS